MNCELSVKRFVGTLLSEKEIYRLIVRLPVWPALVVVVSWQTKPVSANNCIKDGHSSRALQSVKKDERRVELGS